MTPSKIQIIGLIASIVLPFFNIPLIIRIIRRKSSEDLSLVWLFGVYGCLILITPTGWMSTDFTFKVFCLTNVALFSGVVFLVLFYRLKKRKD
jgi:uncharacterized protein with PQ loop repeat